MRVPLEAVRNLSSPYTKVKKRRRSSVVTAKEPAETPWDLHADNYMRLASPCTGFMAQTLFQTIAGRLPRAAQILDIACGCGELSRAALLHTLAQEKSSGARGAVTATDLSSKMLDITRSNLSFAQDHESLRIEQQNGQSLSYPDASFDAVFSAFGIFLFPDRHAGWREAARVLRPGGYFATAVWRDAEHNDLMRLQMEPVLKVLPERIKANLPKSDWRDIATMEGLKNEVCAAGFTNAEASIFDAVLSVPTPESMWDMMEENPVASSLFQDCTDDEKQAIKNSALTSFEARAGGADRALHFNASCHFLIARRQDQ